MICIMVTSIMICCISISTWGDIKCDIFSRALSEDHIKLPGLANTVNNTKDTMFTTMSIRCMLIFFLRALHLFFITNILSHCHRLTSICNNLPESASLTYLLGHLK